MAELNKSNAREKQYQNTIIELNNKLKQKDSNNSINNNYLGYNSTFYNQKNLSIEMEKNYSINDSTKKKNGPNGIKNEKISQRIYYKTPILKNRIKHKKKYIRKKIPIPKTTKQQLNY